MRSPATYTRAKTILARWLDRTDAVPTHRSRVLAGFDRLHAELPNRDPWFETNTVALDRTEGLLAEAVRPRLRVGTWPGGLFVATITPGWEVGWRSVFPDDEVYDVLSWFMHYVRQYVHRSLVVGALMALRDERQVLLHPFGSAQHTKRWGPCDVDPPVVVSRATGPDRNSVASPNHASGVGLPQPAPLRMPSYVASCLTDGLHLRVIIGRFKGCRYRPPGRRSPPQTIMTAGCSPSPTGCQPTALLGLCRQSPRCFRSRGRQKPRLPPARLLPDIQTSESVPESVPL